MLVVPNTIGIKLGNILQGTAEGPLGITALLLRALAALIVLELRRRRP
jgi:hypothetical protein